MAMANALLSGILFGTTSYALINVSPLERPYSFAACVTGCCHALAGFVDYFTCQEAECQAKTKRFTNSCLEIMTVPLINIELYLKSEQSNPLAMGHSLFIIPLAFDLLAKATTEESEEPEESATETLKDLTILGNIVSLLFLATNESNSILGIMALAAFMARYGAALIDNLLSGTRECISLLAYSLILGLVPAAVKSEFPKLPE